MVIVVDRSQSWDDYEKAWINGMKDLLWFRENRLLTITAKKNLKVFGKTLTNQIVSFSWQHQKELIRL